MKAVHSEVGDNLEINSKPSFSPLEGEMKVRGSPINITLTLIPSRERKVEFMSAV